MAQKEPKSGSKRAIKKLKQTTICPFRNGILSVTSRTFFTAAEIFAPEQIFRLRFFKRLKFSGPTIVSG
jgi:hypothetical protein